MEPSIQKPFSIFYDEESNFVDMKSVERIPFEPKGWKLQMREDLKANIRKIIPDKNKILYAAYCDNASVPQKFDLENILFYNIGTSNFSSFASNGIIFESNPYPVEGPLFEETNYNHYYKYMLITPEEPSSFWEPVEKINQFEIKINKPFKTSYKPEFFWLTTKQANISTFKTSPEYSFLGLNLLIQGPQNSNINLTSFIKTLIDGIISAFSYLPQKPDPDLVTILKEKTKESERLLSNLLGSKENAVLGPHNVLHFFNNKKSIQWNPQDDKLLFTKVTYKNSGQRNNWCIKGELFYIKIKEDPRWAFE